MAFPPEKFDYAIGRSSLGGVLVALSAFGIVAIFAGDDPQELVGRLRARFRKIQLHEGGRDAKAALARVIRFIDKPAAGLDLPLNIRGTPFQQKVWHAVRAIPFGATSTYSDIARVINAPRAVRAVGSACTRNLFFLAVPCHRVLRKGDGLSKSSKRQRMLIERETSKTRKR